ncbi:glycosyl transferase family 11 domain-containing protein [Ditylenchus destructor]|uniref:Glycosyl transferase family 11 domain-containing protein n=1 Tax=Ditylenchus destructor TaxID=166010 RepID=A0AAD4MNL1_9BILA|nr:glycosyl transferase family 11 domain-containing protein [Ditylenchus destructor]
MKNVYCCMTTTRISRRTLLLVVIECCLLIILTYAFLFKFYYQHPDISKINVLNNQALKSHPSASEQKFVTCNPIGIPTLCGGLGNHLYRFASLYGIAKALNRTPYYDTYYECVARLYKEIQDTFPNYRKFLRLERRGIHEKTVVEFGKHCCRYDDPSRLKEINSQYLELSAIHLQSYKYFEHVFDEVREMFSFSDRLKEKIDSYSGKLFGNDTNHKLCIHTRRGDFANTNTESKGQFTEKAAEYAASFLHEKYGNVSVILLGKDKQFLRTVNLGRENISSIYIPDDMKRMEDLCFISRYCNSLIITAMHSTFSWWGAFLMQSHKKIQKTNDTDIARGYVFYDSSFAFGGDLHDYSNFLPEWIPLQLVNDTIIVQ